VVRLGFAATSASEGAGKWTPDLNEWFRDRIVYILPDNDQQGAKHADQVARSLVGVAREIRIVPLPGLSDREDVYDWIGRGGTAAQLEDIAAGVSPTSAAGQETADKPLKFKLVPFDDLAPSKITDYLVKGLFPRKGMAEVWGPPKCGQSFWVMTVMLHVAMGRDYRGHRVH
jgi:hypothetical protein